MNVYQDANGNNRSGLNIIQRTSCLDPLLLPPLPRIVLVAKMKTLYRFHRRPQAPLLGPGRRPLAAEQCRRVLSGQTRSLLHNSRPPNQLGWLAVLDQTIPPSFVMTYMLSGLYRVKHNNFFLYHYLISVVRREWKPGFDTTIGKRDASQNPRL